MKNWAMNISGKEQSGEHRSFFAHMLCAFTIWVIGLKSTPMLIFQVSGV
jgi:hypothetical protein